MKIFPKNRLRVADAKEMSHQGERAFTMVEIAIAIGVIGFALVAIIGILPTGMNSQKDNREDTVISQDAPFFLEAIRNGASVSNGYVYLPSAQGLDFLTNYVQLIQSNYYSNGVLFSNSIPYTNFRSGAEIIGLLSTPQNNYNTPGFSSNSFDMTAYVRALSGPASAQQFGANSGPSAFMAFTYKMEVLITPFNSFAPDTTNWLPYYNMSNPDSNQWIIRSNRWLEANAGANVFLPASSTNIGAGFGAMTYNLFEVRLRFSWPVNINGNNITVGPHWQTYRTLVSSTLSESSVNGVTGWFFQPQYYTNSPNL